MRRLVQTYPNFFLGIAGSWLAIAPAVIYHNVLSLLIATPFEFQDAWQSGKRIFDAGEMLSFLVGLGVVGVAMVRAFERHADRHPPSTQMGCSTKGTSTHPAET